MNKMIKYRILVALFVASSIQIGYAQQEKKEKNSEIVMTSEELESFLTTIAERRKEQISKQKKSRATDPLMLSMLSTGTQANDQDLYYREMRLLHDKIDFLLARQGYSTLIQPSANRDLLVVEKQLAEMKNQYGSTQDPEVNRKIEQLTAELNNLKGSSQSSGNVNAVAKHSIYFANNSSKLSTSDLSALNDWIGNSNLQGNEGTRVIRLHGFASKTGSPFYNNKLSFDRANIVKEQLVKMGVPPSKIVMLHHGEDLTIDDKLARRVDLVLSDN